MSDSETLREVLSDVLERMAMVFTDADELENVIAPPEEFHTIELDFNGPASGTLRLVVEAEAALEITAGFLGLDPDDEEVVDAKVDVLGELGNVTLGNLLPALAGDEQIFNLTAPRVSEGQQVNWEEIAGGKDSVGVFIEGSPLYACFEAGDLVRVES